MDDKDWGRLLYEAMVLERQGSSPLADELVGHAFAIVLSARSDRATPPLAKPYLPNHDALEPLFA
jgi:hypothetical protein